jgi:hypothetical protein
LGRLEVDVAAVLDGGAEGAERVNLGYGRDGDGNLSRIFIHGVSNREFSILSKRSLCGRARWGNIYRCRCRDHLLLEVTKVLDAKPAFGNCGTCPAALTRRLT